jgi:hypothetical protein
LRSAGDELVGLQLCLIALPGANSVPTHARMALTSYDRARLRSIAERHPLCRSSAPFRHYVDAMLAGNVKYELEAFSAEKLVDIVVRAIIRRQFVC